MAGPARRDLVWDAALRALVSNPAEIRQRDVQHFIDEEEVSDRTVRRTMNAMHALGWVEKEKEGGHYWQPGPKAREFLRVPSADYPPNDEHSPAYRAAVDRLEEGGGDVDVEGEVDFEREAAPPPTRDEIEVAVEQINVRAQGEEMGRRRRALLEEILRYIREEGEVKPSEIRGKFYPGVEEEGVEPSDAADAVGYGSERSWWKNFVYKALSECDLVETGGEGSHTWFYVDGE
jgi:hypothetical protein